jgi:hypothetical protein
MLKLELGCESEGKRQPLMEEDGRGQLSRRETASPENHRRLSSPIGGLSFSVSGIRCSPRLAVSQTRSQPVSLQLWPDWEADR